MTTSSVVGVDTNVLVYAAYADASNHGPARALLDRAQAGDLTLCLTPQVLAEYYAVITNPRRVSAARTADDALAAIDAYLNSTGFILMPVPVDIVERWMFLVRTTPVSGRHLFDLQLAATLLAHGISKLYTFNTNDFADIPDFEAVAP